MSPTDNAPKRCAIYTRKSSEEGLEQNFNSLHAQRQACEAFVRSQTGEGWRLIKTAYDDGGFSGATLDRPALKTLLTHVREKRIDVVVVYKVDRLTRSLADFAKIVEIFDGHGVSFVAVTQQFNTTTSMGRLTLNVLLSFAQFEREVTGERIRDKIAASKQNGMWMGGTVPLGYDIRDHRLVVNAREAETVRLIFRLYLELGSVRRVRDELSRRSIVSKMRASKAGIHSGGVRFSRGALYEMLANPIYVGEIRHKKVSYRGQHQHIVEKAQWQRVQEMLKQRATRKEGGGSEKAYGLLTGKLFDENGEPLYACWAKKGVRRYRYFVSRKLIRGAHETDDNGWRLPAEEIEQAVAGVARQMLSDQVALASVLKSASLAAPDLKQALTVVERKVKSVDGLESLEAARSIIYRVELRSEGIQVTLNLGPLLAPELSIGGANLRLMRQIPMQMKRRGVETRLVISGERAEVSRTDPALLRAVSRGYQWFGELASGSVTSTKQIAIRERLSHSYVRHVVALGLLAPKVVEAICEGQQSMTISAERLKDHWRLPIEWDAQRRVLAN